MLVKEKQEKRARIPADLDEGSLTDFYVELDRLLKESPGEITVDCSLLDRVGSNHISALWEAHAKCDQVGVAMRLSSVRYGLERVLKILDLYDQFKIDTGLPQPLRLKIKATTAGINHAFDEWCDFLRQLDIVEICAFDLETVFYEVATNILLHSQLGDKGWVEFTATPNREKISLRFVDPGPPFDPATAESAFSPPEAIRGRQKNGLGLTMIKKLVDTISYERVDDQLNVVTLVKKLSQRGGRQMIAQKKLDESTIIIDPGKVLDNNNAPEMVDTISAAQAEEYKYIILDLSELEFLSSAGVGSILGTVETSRERGGDIILCNVPEKILHILEVLDLCDYLTVESNQQTARELCMAKG